MAQQYSRTRSSLSTLQHYPSLLAHQSIVFLRTVLIVVLILLALSGVFFFFHLLHIPLVIFLFFALPISVSTCLLSGTVSVYRNPVTMLRAYTRSVHTIHEQYCRAASIASLADAYPIYVSLDNDNQPSSRTLQDVLLQEGSHCILHGPPGIGKTLAMYFCQHLLLQNSEGNKIPILIPMKDFNTFLQSSNGYPLDEIQSEEQSTEESASIDEPVYISLLGYLISGQLEGIQHIRPYLKKWIRQGRIAFLCDGLDEVASTYHSGLFQELYELMESSENRVIMTCRDQEYLGHPLLKSLIEPQHALPFTIADLDKRQQDEFIISYSHSNAENAQQHHSSYTAEQIVQLIDGRHLRSEHLTPYMLSVLIRLLNNQLHDIGPDISTRGLLLREFVSHLILKAKERAGELPFTVNASNLIEYLGEIACAMYHQQNNAGIRISTAVSLTNRPSYQEYANTLKILTDDPFADHFEAVEDDMFIPPSDFSLVDRARMLEFALYAGLLEISEDHILRFYPDDLVAYFAAEYLVNRYKEQQQAAIPYGSIILNERDQWKEPVRIWAGLIERPMELADCFAKLRFGERDNAYNALILGIMCLGVHWAGSQEQSIPQPSSPEAFTNLLTHFLNDGTKRYHLAETFDWCAQEGGMTIYRFLLTVIRHRGTAELLLKLDKDSIAKLLFEYLEEMVTKDTYEIEIRLVESILGKMGNTIVPHAIALSRPSPDSDRFSSTNRIRLRKAAIDILGRAKDPQGVELLISYLGEDREITEECVSALRQLGPAIALEAILTCLNQSEITHEQKYLAYLNVLKTFLETQELDARQHTRAIKALTSALASPYHAVQSEAHSLLLREAHPIKQYGAQTIDDLVFNLSSINIAVENHISTILGQLGSHATPALVKQLNQPNLKENTIVRIVIALGKGRDKEHDKEALSTLRTLMNASSEKVRDAVATVLKEDYGRHSIPMLIETVLKSSAREEVATAKNLLKDIGYDAVEPITHHLLEDEKEDRLFLLVTLLTDIQDFRAIPQFIKLIEKLLAQILSVSQPNTPVKGLMIELLKRISVFKDRRVAESLLAVLETTSPDSSYYKEASIALSKLEHSAQSLLITSLSESSNKNALRGAFEALVNMNPFPGTALLAALEEQDTFQRQQIESIFLARKNQDADFLVSHLCDPRPFVQQCVHTIVEQMSGDVFVQALVDHLGDKECRSIIINYLCEHKDLALPKLVLLLTHDDDILRDAAKASIIEFGTPILLSHPLALIEGLNNPRSTAYIQDALEKIVLQQQNEELIIAIQNVINLLRYLIYPRTFGQQGAYTSILNILTNLLSDRSVPVLLKGLESEHPQIREGATDALVTLANKNDEQGKEALQLLIDSLAIEFRRPQAANTLKKIGDKALPKLLELINDNTADTATIQASKSILSQTSTPTTLLNVFDMLSSSNQVQRNNGVEIFSNMAGTSIVDILLKWLRSDSWPEIQRGLALLIERIRLDTNQVAQNEKMISLLLTHLQTQREDTTTVRILTLFLLLPKQELLGYLGQSIVVSKQTHNWFMPLFLLLALESDDAKTMLLHLMNVKNIPYDTYKELFSILGMLEDHRLIIEAVSSLSKRTLPLQNEHLELAHRALGTQLVRGRLSISQLQDFEKRAIDETPEHEFFTMLLNGSYVPRVKELHKKAENLQAELKLTLERHSREVERLQEDIDALKRSLRKQDRELNDKKLELSRKEEKQQKDQRTIDNLNRQVGELKAENEQLTGRLQMPRMPRPPNQPFPPPSGPRYPPYRGS